MKCLTTSIHGGGGFQLGLLLRDRGHAPLHAFFHSPAKSFMVTCGDGSSLEAREMNGQHALPTGDHEGRPYGWSDYFVKSHNMDPTCTNLLVMPHGRVSHRRVGRTRCLRFRVLSIPGGRS